jgi:hypothetical protein
VAILWKYGVGGTFGCKVIGKMVRITGKVQRKTFRIFMQYFILAWWMLNFRYMNIIICREANTQQAQDRERSRRHCMHQYIEEIHSKWV